MQMHLFHGSDHIIEKPEYGMGKPYNDYGLGFYCTEDRDMAAEWSVEENRDGFINSYNLETDSLNILDLNREPYTVLHWISVLISNRTFELNTPLAREGFRYLQDRFAVDLSDYDIVMGYRADDSYFSFAQDFLSGVISVSQLSNALKLGMLGEQVMIKSKPAFDRLRFVGSESTESAIWFDRKQKRDHKARLEYRRMNKRDYIHGDLYMLRIIDEEVQADDPRLR